MVIGGGHAGCEAALAAARMGCRTLLLTSNLERVAYLPCNSSIGGPAKGHLVRELAAIGGEMPYNADRCFVQVRMLNTSKGPAVQALRAQADKTLYPTHMRAVLERTPNLLLRQGMAAAIETEGDAVCAVRTDDGARYPARAVIVTTGTFLAARIMAGAWEMPAGRQGDPPARGLSASLESLGLRLTRMQTNTPPRVDARTVDFALTERQFGSDVLLYFGLYYDRQPPAPPFAADQIHPIYPIERQSAWRAQVPTYVVRTNPETHRLARESLHLSPIAAGLSQGTGPRYCPSFEEKLIRFPERESHLVFLEPEGYNTTEMYVQGLFTALPISVQEDLLHSIPALRGAHMTRPGYAVEYDVLLPGQFDPSLQARAVRGLYFAGQVNGTSGYEEAAGQGWLAGVNAALSLRGEEPVMLRRDQAYIGVMVDDLITKEHTEPYRLFTSRAEFRLLLRQDNADLRLAEVAARLGLVSEEFRARVERKRAQVKE
ncbi:MAG: tRNA uridine-5-carboxymethylaminomethyl(34) synthesis enzyme MnmG, partial [Anaerolineae bacterium]